MAWTLPSNCTLPALLLALLTACTGDTPGGAYRDYHERLARTLAVDSEPRTQPQSPLPPRVGALQLALEGGNINTLDFLALRGCALQVNVARRNSSLGRLARPSQTLLLDLEFLRLAPACVEDLEREGRNALKERLLEAQALKRAQLPARVFNATLGSDEYRAFWRGTRPPGDYPAVPDTVTLQALHAINAAVARWLAGDYSVDGFEFELLLSEVAGGDGGGLLRALARQAHWLAEADSLLAARGNRGPLCGPNLRHDAADILPNVVEKYFVGQIQPGAAALHRSFHALLPPVRELETRLGEVLPDDYLRWRDARDRLLERGSGAPRRHVNNVQVLLQPCGRSGR